MSHPSPYLRNAGRESNGPGRRAALGLGLILLSTTAFLFLRETRQATPEIRPVEPSVTDSESARQPPSLPFTDLAAVSGVDFVHTNGAYGDKLLPETMGGGVALFDADGDGDTDVLFVDSGPWTQAMAQPESNGADSDVGQSPALARLYRNEGNFRFLDVTSSSGLASLETQGSLGRPYGMGVAVGDIEGDGDVDLFLTGVGANRLLRNLGDGTFVDITGEAGVAGEPDAWSTSAGFFDADGDGDLDLMVCNYLHWSPAIEAELDFRLAEIGRAYGPPQSYGGTYPYLYRNRGDGTFVDITAESGLRIADPTAAPAGIAAPAAKALALAPVDMDGDGRLDVLVANDTVGNFLFRNRGSALGAGSAELFEEIAEMAGVAYDRDGNATGAMGVDVAYYRNDVELGFAVGNYADEMSSIYLSQGDPLFFVDEGLGEGIGAATRRSLTFGLLFLDLDLDGRLDLFQANGHVEPEIATIDPGQSYAQPSQVFWNTGLGLGGPGSSRAGAKGARFVLLGPEQTGDLGRDIVGRGAAYADLDGDGDLDLVVTQIAGPPLVLRNDQATGHHWLRLRLADPGANTAAIGAWVEVTAGGVTQRRQVMPVRSYLSQVEPVLTFGLGSATEVDRLLVRWPDGQIQEVDPPEIDRLHRIQRGPKSGLAQGRSVDR